MRDADCIEFLQWSLPRMGMRWAGFRRVRRQVCRRLSRRVEELGLADLAAYRERLQSEATEWDRLDALCRVTISRFYRDRGVWDRLCGTVLPDLARRARRHGDAELRCWSIGCASGEEPYTLALIWRWKMRDSPISLRIVATDADERLLERARAGRYGESSLRDLPTALRRRFTSDGGHLRIDPDYREPITFVRQDIRRDEPDERFHLILCRNLVFTYYDEELQRRLLQRMREHLVPGGALVTGIHETLPSNETWKGDGPGIHRWPGASSPG